MTTQIKRPLTNGDMQLSHAILIPQYADICGCFFYLAKPFMFFMLETSWAMLHEYLPSDATRCVEMLNMFASECFSFIFRHYCGFLK